MTEPKNGGQFWRRRYVLAAAGALAATPVLAEEVQIGKVDDSAGEAFARRTAIRRLSPGTGIFLGDFVWTGEASRVRLSLGSHTRIFLGARAGLAIDRFVADAGGDLVLGAGALIYDHDETVPPPDVRVRSDFALLAVRGTRFFAGPSRNVFGVFVERGLVDVQAAGVTRRLGPGEGANVPRPGAPPGPVVRWTQDHIQEAYASVLG